MDSIDILSNVSRFLYNDDLKSLLKCKLELINPLRALKIIDELDAVKYMKYAEVRFECNRTLWQDGMCGKGFKPSSVTFNNNGTVASVYAKLYNCDDLVTSLRTLNCKANQVFISLSFDRQYCINALRSPSSLKLCRLHKNICVKYLTLPFDNFSKEIISLIVVYDDLLKQINNAE